MQSLWEREIWCATFPKLTWSNSFFSEHQLIPWGTLAFLGSVWKLLAFKQLRHREMRLASLHESAINFCQESLSMWYSHCRWKIGINLNQCDESHLWTALFPVLCHPSIKYEHLLWARYCSSCWRGISDRDKVLVLMEYICLCVLCVCVCVCVCLTVVRQ